MRTERDDLKCVSVQRQETLRMLENEGLHLRKACAVAEEAVAFKSDRLLLLEENFKRVKEELAITTSAFTTQVDNMQQELATNQAVLMHQNKRLEAMTMQLATSTALNVTLEKTVAENQVGMCQCIIE